MQKLFSLASKPFSFANLWRRGMAFIAPVKDGNVDAALASVNKYYKEEGVLASSRKQEYYLRPALRKREDKIAHHARNMGRVIHERVDWVVKRKKIRI